MSSSRRAAGPEDSILASLERGSGGARAAQRSWLIIGGTAAAILIAMLGWIAYNNATSVRTLPVSAVKRAVPEPEPVAQRAAAPLAQAAAIIDEMPRAPAVAEPARPALVMLPPEEIGGQKQPAPRQQAVAAPVTEVAPVPRPAIARATGPERKVEKTATRSPAPRPAAIRTAALQPAPRPATAKKVKSAPPKPIVVPELDSDVALISAIVAHSTRHAAERARQENCQGKKCAARDSSEP